MQVDSPTLPDLGFAPYFTARWATRKSDTSELDEAFRLRFDVYCIDCAFLDAADYPSGRESDAYDDDATHFYAHNLVHELVGYVRLAQADDRKRFPWELHCNELLPGIELPDRACSAEVSRLMVRRDYRRRKGDLIAGVQAQSPAPDRDGVERRAASPQIMLSLYRQMYQFSLGSGIRFWYAAMERPLARALQAMGFSFRRIGAEVDYFGPVAPYLAEIEELEAMLRSRNPALLHWLKASFPTPPNLECGSGSLTPRV
jgi:N-acyl amino acid synthase of PEP-CTERM/exosortase system